MQDIPATGSDQWYNLYEDRKMRTRALGQVRLKLELSIKQDADQLDSAESDQCSVEDYHHIVLKTYSHALQSAREEVHQVGTEVPKSLQCIWILQVLPLGECT